MQRPSQFKSVNGGKRISMEDKILIFIPAYNCEKQIVRVLDQLDEDVMRYVSGVIVVNNRSTDHTEDAVVRYAQEHPALPLALLRNRENYILGGSHKVAFEYAMRNGFDYVIVLHGDDQGSIHDLMPILESREYRKYDCCLGSRFMNGSRLQGYSLLRTVVNRCFNLWYSVWAGCMIRDLGSGLNLYHVPMLESRYYLKYPDKLYFNAVMVLADPYYRHAVKFFPITWREDDQQSNAKLIRLGIQLLKLPVAYALRKKKFMESEMRERPVESYEYDVICENVRSE